MAYDFLIVGGGSSGCVLANRLSASGRSVLLIEAGVDTAPGSVPDDILDANPTRAYFNPRYRWKGLKARFSSAQDRYADYEQARVIGGGSSINAQVANRGGPDDYDGWAKAGAAGWAWSDVLPYFCKLEADQDFAGPLHGQSGPLPIQRVKMADWSGFIRAVAAAYETIGLRLRPDFNGEFSDGYSPVPLTNLTGKRVSTAIAYLTSDVRARPNLKILTDTTVLTIVMQDGAARGVMAERDGCSIRHDADQIILCCGSIHTPALLMRSGIGDGQALAKLGIKVHANVPGVGKNLQEHPSIAVSGYLQESDRMPAHVIGHIQLHARYSSGVDGCPATDMAISAVAKSAWHPLGKRLGSLQLWVNRTFSTGAVTLVSSDPHAEPVIDFNWLSDARDLDRLKRGFRLLAKLFQEAPLNATALDPFPSAWDARSKRISTMSRTNYVITAILARIMDSSVMLRRLLINKAITQGQGFDRLLADDGELEKYVLRTVTGNWHPTSTCKMGTADDPLAVTDSAGRVRKVANLRIADASVMPFCPRANTNIPTIMVAEKMSDLILRETV